MPISINTLNQHSKDPIQSQIHYDYRNYIFYISDNIILIFIITFLHHKNYRQYHSYQMTIIYLQNLLPNTE